MKRLIGLIAAAAFAIAACNTPAGTGSPDVSLPTLESASPAASASPDTSASPDMSLEPSPSESTEASEEPSSSP